MPTDGGVSAGDRNASGRLRQDFDGDGTVDQTMTHSYQANETGIHTLGVTGQNTRVTVKAAQQPMKTSIDVRRPRDDRRSVSIHHDDPTTDTQRCIDDETDLRLDRRFVSRFERHEVGEDRDASTRGGAEKR